jgi:integrase
MTPGREARLLFRLVRLRLSGRPAWTARADIQASDSAAPTRWPTGRLAAHSAGRSAVRSLGIRPPAQADRVQALSHEPHLTLNLAEGVSYALGSLVFYHSAKMLDFSDFLHPPIISVSPIFSHSLGVNWGINLGIEADCHSAVRSEIARGGIEKLKVSDLKNKEPGLLSDGGNLYLQVSRGKDGNIRRSWIFRFKLSGKKERDMGLGSLDAIGLAKARELSMDYRELVATGFDPIERRKEARANMAATIPVPSFDEVAKSYISAHRPGWRNPVHSKQWETTLKAYASPVIGKLPVNVITTELVMKVLEPIWNEKTDTAKRVRGRIEAVLNYATVRKFRHGDNPARWNGYLSELLARPSRVAPVEHHAALDYRSMGAFMAALREREGVGALALQFTVLTCARTAETLGATWDEIDLNEKVWIVPGARIKAGIEHRVPLSKAALTVLHETRSITEKIGGPVMASKLVFPNDRTGGRLSSNALLAVLKRMKRSDVTTHGFRSAFRDWVGEDTNFSNDAAELALAHKVPDKVEAAYRRGSMFVKRRQLMEAWSAYCAKPLAAKDGRLLTFRR